jgi:hypothetical protein
MSEIIKVKLNKDNRAIANLFSKDFDLTELAGEDGKGEFKAFGKTYQFEIVSKSRAKREKAMDDAESEETPKLEDVPVDSEETKTDE